MPEIDINKRVFLKQIGLFLAYFLSEVNWPISKLYQGSSAICYRIVFSHFFIPKKI